ncbi:DUF3618 domain-containing protein [Teichococcus oryzae]|uniref:DUF3618 domain-containing protein n=1 Tax=Teichococcus oryzae TaxID=1608942 RepID=A0A5B2THF2_9PROT|nr:DUF3618 domain-containing protein [Pseudoroseomonas oryzae]KAA2213425.1 DUF3618 domain-containing protein [Pseudoroseomonas oryzae]
MSDRQHDNRSTAEIEADVERTRADVSQTIEQLRESLSPGQIMDQLVDYARSSGGAEFTRNLGASVRDNPLPLLLVGAGIGWMMLSNQNRSHGTVHREVYPGRTPLLPYDNAPRSPYTDLHSGPSTTDRISGAAGQAAETVRGAADSAGSAVRSAANAVRDAVTGAASAVSAQASSLGQQVSDHTSAAGDAMRMRSHDARDAASRGLDTAYGQANYLSSQMRDSWNRAGPAQPLIIGGVGLLMGAALAAMLPRTRTEDRLMGETSDAVRQQVAEVAQQQYEEAKSVVTERAGEAADALKQNKDAASGLPDAARNTLHGVADAAVKATRDLSDVAKSGVEDKKDSDADRKPVQHAGLGSTAPGSPGGAPLKP